MDKNYDFSGWVTKNDTLCSDGVIIRHDAFSGNHNTTVPLVWNHNGQATPSNILGHILLSNRDQGVYGYGYFNDSDEAEHAKKAIKHGDITAMSIGANRIKKQNSRDVVHGNIYEVSLVLAGANPGALIENVIAHSELDGEAAIIYDPMSTLHAREYDDDLEHADENGEDLIHNLVSSMTQEELQDVFVYAASLVDPDTPVDEIMESLTEEDSQKVSDYIIDMMERNDEEAFVHADGGTGGEGGESAAESGDGESSEGEMDDSETDDSEDYDDESDDEDEEDDDDDEDSDITDEDIDNVLQVIDSLNESEVSAIFDKALEILGPDFDGDDPFDALDEDEADELLSYIADLLDDDDASDADDVVDAIDYLSEEAILDIMAYARELSGDDESDEDSLLENLSEEDSEKLRKYVEKKIKGDTEMRQNAFSAGYDEESVIEHAQLCEDILQSAEACGSLKQSMINHGVSSTIDDLLAGRTDYDDVLEHSISTIDDLLTVETFEGAPSLIRPEEPSMVDVILGKVKTTPRHTVRKRFADLTTEEARAKGYIKGNQKLEEVFGTMDRVTYPQTIYKKQSIDNDDLIDIDWDIVSFIRSEMREMWRYELARAIFTGDGRTVGAADKIKEDHIRPIMSDDTFYVTTKYSVTASSFVEDIITALAASYKGTGTPDLYIDKTLLAQIRLLKATDGHYLWGDKPISKTDLADLLGVAHIYEPDFLNNTSKAVAVNLTDYEVAAPNKGKSQSYEDFDIDYNKHKYLLEGRCAGALVQPKAAVVLTASAAPTTQAEG